MSEFDVTLLALLNAVKSNFEQATAIVEQDVKPRVKQAIQLLVEIDYQ